MYVQNSLKFIEFPNVKLNDQRERKGCFYTNIKINIIDVHAKVCVGVATIDGVNTLT